MSELPSSVPKLKALFLSGGKSQRMGTDKALLQYSGVAELKRWWKIFQNLSIPFFWSQRPFQYRDDVFPEIPRIEDASPGSGPLAALLSAYASHRECAWLVIACDWPLLRETDIRNLLGQRNPLQSATAYALDTGIEPLCSIYEPDFLRFAKSSFAQGEQSLYRLLQQVNVNELTAENPARFLNANDPKAQALALQQLPDIRLPFSQNPLHRSDC